MLICAAGDIHGAMDRLYDDVLAFEEALGMRFNFVLHVGDFGVRPDPGRVDKATRKHDGAGDFPDWFAGNRAAHRPTVFIKGNHEDFVWLDETADAQSRPLRARQSWTYRHSAAMGPRSDRNKNLAVLPRKWAFHPPDRSRQ